MEDQGDAPRRTYAPQRSAASTNWRTKDTTPRADPPQQQRQNNRSNISSPRPQHDSSSPGTRLYIGNLLYTATKPDVEALFTSNGFNITGISMSVDPFTGRNPSYAFVDLESAEEANRAMEALNGAELLGRGVRINPGVRKGEGQSSGGDRGQRGQYTDVRREDNRGGKFCQAELGDSNLGDLAQQRERKY
jgi:RNA recognition motif-containing protein